MLSFTSFLVFALFVAGLSNAMSTNKKMSSSRRFFLTKAVPTGSLAFVVATALAPREANAYERRDVGGPDRSPETAAMNIQAYETQNRLEASGFKLDTNEQQAATLASALSDYSYDPGTSSKSKKETKQSGKKR